MRAAAWVRAIWRQERHCTTLIYSTFKAISVFHRTFVLQPIKRQLTLTWHKESGSVTSRCQQWQCLCSHIQPWEISHQNQKRHSARARMPCSTVQCFTEMRYVPKCIRCVGVCLCVSRWWSWQVCHQQKDWWDTDNDTTEQATSEDQFHAFHHGKNATSFLFVKRAFNRCNYDSALLWPTSYLPVHFRCARWMTIWSTALHQFWSELSARTCSLRSSTEPPSKVSSFKAPALPLLCQPMGTRCCRSRCQTVTFLT